jgi:ABC-type spermidine/putrescine transport system permease subunit II
MKVGVTPKTNALCTLLFAATAALALLSAYVSRRGNAAANTRKKANSIANTIT